MSDTFHHEVISEENKKSRSETNNQATTADLDLKATSERKQKACLITGASSGIGLAIAKALLAQSYVVYGIGRDFKKTNFTHPCFHPTELNLCDTSKLLAYVKELKQKAAISLLINNAGVGYYGPHEEIAPHKLQEMVTVNLTVPMILSQAFLRDFKNCKGTILNISSITAHKTNTYGCSYGATKAGLSSFAGSLFEECRKYGVKVITLQPDMTQTNLYRNANFKEGDTDDTYLYPEDIADAVTEILSLRDGLVVNELTLRPQRHSLGKK